MFNALSLILLLVAGSAVAAPKSDPMKEVLIHSLMLGEGKIGDTVKPDVGIYLYTHAPCSLNIDGQEHMRRFIAGGREGCWFPSLDGHPFAFYPDGRVEPAVMKMPMELFVRCVVQPDGRVLITDPNYTTDFYIRGIQRYNEKLVQQQHNRSEY